MDTAVKFAGIQCRFRPSLRRILQEEANSEKEAFINHRSFEIQVLQNVTLQDTKKQKNLTAEDLVKLKDGDRMLFSSGKEMLAAVATSLQDDNERVTVVGQNDSAPILTTSITPTSRQGGTCAKTGHYRIENETAKQPTSTATICHQEDITGDGSRANILNCRRRPSLKRILQEEANSEKEAFINHRSFEIQVLQNVTLQDTKKQKNLTAEDLVKLKDGDRMLFSSGKEMLAAVATALQDDNERVTVVGQNDSAPILTTSITPTSRQGGTCAKTGHYRIENETTKQPTSTATICQQEDITGDGSRANILMCRRRPSLKRILQEEANSEKEAFINHTSFEIQDLQNVTLQDTKKQKNLTAEDLVKLKDIDRMLFSSGIEMLAAVATALQDDNERVTVVGRNDSAPILTTSITPTSRQGGTCAKTGHYRIENETTKQPTSTATICHQEDITGDGSRANISMRTSNNEDEGESSDATTAEINPLGRKQLLNRRLTPYTEDEKTLIFSVILELLYEIDQDIALAHRYVRSSTWSFKCAGALSLYERYNRKASARPIGFNVPSRTGCSLKNQWKTSLVKIILNTLVKGKRDFRRMVPLHKDRLLQNLAQAYKSTSRKASE